MTIDEMFKMNLVINYKELMANINYKELMANINAGKGIPPIGDNADRSNKKIMADINAGKGIPPIPMDGAIDNFIVKAKQAQYEQTVVRATEAMDKAAEKILAERENE